MYKKIASVGLLLLSLINPAVTLAAATSSPTTVPSGTLALSIDASSPSYAVVAGGMTGVVVGAYKVYASGESINVTQFGLKLASGLPADITHAYIYNGATLVGSTVFTGNLTTATTTFASAINVPANGSVTLTVKVDTSAIGVGQAGTSGDLIKIDPSMLVGTGVSSGTLISGVGSGDVAGIRVFKSYPIVTSIPLPSTNAVIGSGVSAPIMRFSVTASPSGPVGIDKYGFNLVASQASLTLPMYAVYNDPAFSTPVPGYSPSTNGVGYVTASLSSSGVFAGGPISIFLGSSGHALEIPAGQTYYFEVRDAVTASGANPLVTTTVVGDPAYQPFINANGANVLQSNFFWSPNSNGTSQFADTDWTDGFGIMGLPAGGFSQTIIGSAPTASSSSVTVSAGAQPANSLAPQYTITPFTQVILTNTGTAPLTISSFIIQRTGIAADAAFNSIDIWDSAQLTKLGAATLNSNHQATINAPVTLNPGEARAVNIDGEMAGNLTAYAGQVASLALIGLNTSATVAGSLPITGAQQTLNASLTDPCAPAYGYRCWGTGTTTTGSGSLTATAIGPRVYTQVTAGSSGVTAGTFALQANGADVTVQKVALSLSAARATPADIGTVSLFSGPSQIGTVSFAGTRSVGGFYYATMTLPVSLTIANNAAPPFSIKADIAQIGPGQPGTDGHRVILNLADAVGVSSGMIVHSGPLATSSLANVAIFRSIPTVALNNSLPRSGASDGRLIAFAVSASPNGPIGLDKMTFTIQPSAGSGTGVSAPRLYAFTDPALSQPVSGSATGGIVGSTLKIGNVATTTFATPLEIPAGATWYFLLKGTVTTRLQNYSITTTLRGAAADPGSVMHTTAQIPNGIFIWSPNGQGTSAPATADWTTGFGVSGLPATGIVQVRTNGTVANSADQLSNLASVLTALQSILSSLAGLINNNH